VRVGCGSAGWWGGWSWIVWIEELGSQRKHARQEAGEVLHSARGAHLEGRRVGDVEQVPRGRREKQVVDDTTDGFKVCGSKKGGRQSRLHAKKKAKSKLPYTYSTIASPCARITGTA